MQRTHSKIVADIGNSDAVSELLRRHGHEVKPTAVQSWRIRPTEAGNIPSPYWKALVDEGVTTYDELATAAQRRSRREAAA